MTTKFKAPIESEQIARELGLRLAGPSRRIVEICPLEALAVDGLSFILNGRAAPAPSLGTVVATEAAAAAGLSVIVSQSPRLDFIRAQYLIEEWPGFVEDASPPKIHHTVRVGRNTVIENGVEIGEGTRIGSCVVIQSGTRIGRHCVIKSGAVIGEPGFGFERDENRRPLKMLHLGGVRVGDHVEIGALCTVVRGALGDTVLEDYVKLDDHVHVAHNCHIGEGAMLTACVELSGSVKVGKNVWLAPNCSVVQKVTLGDDCFIGIGSVVARAVEPGTKVFGNPAKRLVSHSASPGTQGAHGDDGPRVENGDGAS